MSELPPKDAREDPEAFINYLRENDAEKLAEYLSLLYEDYYDGNLTGSGRHFRLESEEVTDISSAIDLAVIFGFVWERDDPAEEAPSTE